MGKVFVGKSTSLDGFVAGPNQTLDDPLGEGGEQLHEWVFELKSWRERHGMSGGETGPDNDVAVEEIRRGGATGTHRGVGVPPGDAPQPPRRPVAARLYARTYVASCTARTLPAGSLNQAMVGPSPRAMPFSSCSMPS
jgi:hypothetical protein